VSGPPARARQPAPRPAAAALQAGLDAVPLPIVIVDASGEIALANRALRSRPDGAAATGAFATRFPEYHAALGGQLAAAREVAVTRNANGAAIHERLVVRPTPWGAAITVLDETPGAEASLQNAQATRLASLGFMVAGVCHEVSNPLAAIHSMVQILRSKRGASPAVLEKGLASISSNIGRILAITRTLTDFSRVGDGPVEPVQVAQAVDEATALLWHQADAHGVTVEAAIDGGVAVLARAGQLERVVYNVLLNAAQAMGGHGRVHVAGERRDGRVVLEIRDAGPGIAPEHLGRVFEPFFTTKADGAGTGLGLAVASEIVHELGGEMRAANLASGGACFAIDLPAAPEAAQP
jgi:C4-dicarboxylate-specific signal transduction histidine kinase